MKKTEIKSDHAPAPIGPYSQAIMVGDTLYVSGQIAIDQATGNMVTSVITKETEQVMNNLGKILEEAGLGYQDVVKCSIFVTNMGDFQAINDIYGRFFEGMTPPARETVQVSALPKGVHVEISCIAVKQS